MKVELPLRLFIRSQPSHLPLALNVFATHSLPTHHLNMGKIRVKVVILPCNTAAREDVIAPWIEPCPEDFTLQALCDKIVETFADLHEGKGLAARYSLSTRACPSLKLIIRNRELNIKRIQDFDGNILSCRLTVGEAFKESQNIADRTVKVVRLPPERQELNDNPLRFASIAPASSACPQKRSQGAYPYSPGTNLRNVIDADSWIAESTEHSDDRPFKRQRLQDVGPRSAAHEIIPPPLPRAGTENRMHQRLPSTSRHGSSIRQVEDSQRSSARKGLPTPQIPELVLTQFKAHNPYGTPLSLPINSPLHIISSSQDDPLAIPDSPERNAWSRNRNGYPPNFRFNTERAKSESPELSVSIREYPSSQPRTPEEPATSAPSAPSAPSVPTSSQPTSSCVQDTTRRDDNLQNPPGPRNPAEVYHFSPHVDSSSTDPSSHRGYHILRSVQEERPSQIDPIETDDSLSHEKLITSRTTPRNILRSPPTTSTIQNSVGKPFLDGGVNDRSNSRLKGAEGPQNTKIVPENEAAVNLVASKSVQTSTHSKESPQLPLTKSLSESQASFHVAPPRASHDTVQRPRHEEGNATTCEDQSLNKAEITDASDLIMSEDQLGENPNEAVPNDPIREPTSCMQTPVAKDRTRDQVQHVSEGDEDAARLARVSNTSTNNTEERDDGRVDNHSEPGKISEPLSKQVHTRTGPTKQKHDVGINSVSHTGFGPDTEHHPRENAVRKDSLDSGSVNANPSQAGQSEQIKASVIHKARDAKIEQRPARQSTVSTLKKGSGSEESPITSAGIGLKESEVTSETKGKTSRAKVAVTCGRIGDIGTPKGQKLGASSTIMPNSEEKREAEEKAKRQADAVAYFLAKDSRRQSTPSSTKSLKQKPSNSKLVTGSVAADASVQRLRKPTVADSDRSSSPSVNDDSVGKRRSMTPLFPSSLIRPTKSALRTSSSSTRRSVSFNDDPIAPPGVLSTASSKLPRSKLGNSNDTLEPIAESKASKSHPLKSQKSPSRASNEATPVVKKLPASEPPSHSTAGRKAATPVTTGPKPKTQSKLTITRDVKLKGRVEGPSKASIPLKEKDEVVSSDSEKPASTFYSDEEDQPRSVKAGPSKKRKLTGAMKAAAAATTAETEKQQQPVVAIPRVQAKSPATSERTTKASLSEGTVLRSSTPSYAPKTPIDGAVNDIASRETSTSRSPAQYVSKASSVSSSSRSDSRSSVVSRGDDGSESESGSEYETGSDSEDDSESVAESDSSSGSSANSPPTNLPDRKDLTSGVPQATSSEKLLNRKSPPKSAKFSSLVNSTEEDEEQTAKEIDQQLKGEYRQSIQLGPPKSAGKLVSEGGRPIKSTALVKKPTNSRFPSLTGLRGKVSASGVSAVTTTTPWSNAPAASNVGSKAVDQKGTKTIDEGSSSSSESDDGSSSSDDQGEEGVSQKSVPKTPTPQPGPIKGIRSLLKRMFPYGAPDS